ncbi:MAG: hypothetical protein U0T73_08685 [Chitinophagales bacterium]
MKWQQSLLRFLNVRRDEAWLVRQLFFLQFFQGAGIALFFTAANALFLESFEIRELPKVYCIAAALLWITGFVYSKVEHALTVKRLIAAIILFMTASVLIFRIGINVFGSPFLYIMLAWFNVLYLLGNLEFWGLSALLFDIRQSKRLFGIISAGDIPAKFIGYISASLVAPYIGSENMLFLAMCCIPVSLIFWRKLSRAGKLDLHVEHDHYGEHSAGEFHNPQLAKMVRDFFGNRLILTVAILSFLVVACASIINFSFYAQVKENIHGDKQLAAFIGLFLAFGRIVAILFKLIFTGKFTNAFGLKGSLLITPVMLLLFAIAVVFSPALTENDRLVLYVFGLMAVLSETLKTALQDPVFIALMQPLRSHLRLKGHTIVKGVMDPFALLFSAGIIWVEMQITGTADLHVLSWVLIVMIAAWIVWVFVVDKSYLSSLVEGLKNRYLSGNETDLNNEQTIAFVSAKMEHGATGETIYLLKLIERQHHESRNTLIMKALRHADDRVKIEAIGAIERLKLQSALPELYAILKSAPSEQLLAETIQAVCILQQEDVEDFSAYLENKDLSVVKASVIGLLKNGSINAIVAAGQKLQLLIEAAETGQRKIAAEIIGELRVKSFYKSLLRLLNDKEQAVVTAAIQASGKLQSEKLSAALIQLFEQNRFQKEILQALAQSGTAALPAISAFVNSGTPSPQTRLKMMQQVGHIGGKEAHELLLKWAGESRSQRLDGLHQLHLAGFHSPGNSLLEGWLRDDMAFAGKLLSQLHFVEQQGTHPKLLAALRLELSESRERLLWLFSFLYDKEKVMRARNGFQIQKKESLANAFELIDLTVPKEFSLAFARIFEEAALIEKLAELRLSPVATEKTLWQDLLGSAGYNRWTQAVAIYTLPDRVYRELPTLLQPYMKHNDLLLRETCAAAIKPEVAL